MGDGSLTQQEIDALLQGAENVDTDGDSVAVASSGRPSGTALSSSDRDAIQELIHQVVLPSTQGLSMILSRNISVGAPITQGKSQSDIEHEFGAGYSVCVQKLTQGLNGSISTLMSNADAGRLSQILMGNDESSSSDMDSALLTTYKEAIGQLLASMATQLSLKVGSAVMPVPCEAFSTVEGVPFPIKDATGYAHVSFPLRIDSLPDSRLNFIIPLPLVTEMIQKSKRGASADSFGGNMNSGYDPTSMQGSHHVPVTEIQDVQYPALNLGGPQPTSPNMNLLLDVQMTLTVELGRTKMYIKEILGLGEGSIIELDKLAGEPVDLLVNSKLIAKGEVVVIDENFGVRVTDIVSAVDRAKTVKGS